MEVAELDNENAAMNHNDQGEEEKYPSRATENVIENKVSPRKSLDKFPKVENENVQVNFISNDEESSQASEFVDAKLTNDEAHNSTEQEDIPNTPIRDQKYMEFLHESWANLADQEQEEVLRKQENERIVDESPMLENQQNIEDSCFKLVTHKKKQHKSYSSGTKSKYNIRSRIVQNKPFR